MFVSSDFLGYLNRKKDIEKKGSPNHLVPATLKSSPGTKEKAPQMEYQTDRHKRARAKEIDYLNERSSNLNVIL
ncbi:MAG: hypothetical protein LBR53_05055 [Deltaproteobacteria bacterium]|jgi:hypothetical protein|nr:hypothetical protein [Deltaproteobacteria bacterium]